jgi:thiol-disulfide isomerase/thioredoxin
MGKKIIILLGMAVMTLFFMKTGPMGAESHQSAGLIQWRTLKQGKAEATRRNMPVLVDFYFAHDCPRCIALDKDVYANEQIAERINRQFIPVRVYLNKGLSREEKKLMNELKGGGECILAFLDPKGKIVKDDKGADISTMEMIPPEKYIWYMDQALLHLGN